MIAAMIFKGCAEKSATGTTMELFRIMFVEILLATLRKLNRPLPIGIGLRSVCHRVVHPILQKLHDVVPLVQSRDVERRLSKFILRAGGCAMVEKELDHSDMPLADGFVQRSITEISRCIDVGPRMNQCRNLVHVSADGSYMKWTLAEIANLVYVFKSNLNECGKIFVFITL
jgi:hypothetical protein